MDPDAVIIATGSYFDGSNIPGGKTGVELGDFIKGGTKAGARVTVIGIRGAELAVALARERKAVTLLEEGPDSTLHTIPWIYSMTMRSFVLLDYMRKEKNLVFLADVKLQEVTDKSVTFLGKDGKKQTLQVDTVIIAANQSPLTDLKKTLQGKIKEIYDVGDCVMPGTIKDAIHLANTVVRAAMELD
jgi:pyruvate/2-oxoglutarate dehydrogenase complex dihydrolipoamide dehydrogenase (E3) component